MLRVQRWKRLPEIHSDDLRKWLLRKTFRVKVTKKEENPVGYGKRKSDFSEMRKPSNEPVSFHSQFLCPVNNISEPR